MVYFLPSSPPASASGCSLWPGLHSLQLLWREVCCPLYLRLKCCLSLAFAVFGLLGSCLADFASGGIAFCTLYFSSSVSSFLNLEIMFSLAAEVVEILLRSSLLVLFGSEISPSWYLALRCSSTICWRGLSSRAFLEASDFRMSLSLRMSWKFCVFSLLGAWAFLINLGLLHLARRETFTLLLG